MPNLIGARTRIMMHLLPFTDGIYRTRPEAISWFARTSPSVAFYYRLIGIVVSAGLQAKRSVYDDQRWSQDSLAILQALETVGVHFEMSGIRYVEQLDTPCVIIANHMSMLETTVIPVIIQPIRKITFIIKPSLLQYPFFKHVMRSRDPIAVSQTNPRHDLKLVLEGGLDRLKRGISIVVFPQGARTPSFEPELFNTLGIKLAKKADVPVVPLALVTDAWANGRYVKDLGAIDPSKHVRFAFGQPLWVRGRGTDEHQAIIQFIHGKLKSWKDESQER